MTARALAWAVRQRGPLVGAALGVVLAFVGFGPGYIFGTSEFWSYPPTDFNSHVIGYRAYVDDAWRWPLFFTRSLDAPDGINILFMDSLPPVALLAKAMRGVVPGFLHGLWRNPFGLWHLLSYALQGAFGSLVVRAARGRGVVAEISGAAVALSMSVFVLRFYHTALSSHFLLLASVWLYLVTRDDEGEAFPKMSRRRDLGVAARWASLLAACLSIHPYLFAMSAAVFVASLGTWALGRRWLRVVIAAALAGATVLAVMTVGGFFVSSTFKGGAWGFGYKSTDLASFFVPQYSPFFPTRAHALAIDMARNEAAEGWDYLGVGVVALAIAMVVRAPREIGRAMRRHACLLVVLLLMAAWAVGNRITVAQKVVFELPMPGVLEWFVRQFRSSGRFIWPLTYVGALYSVALASRVFATGHLRFATPLLAYVQLLDGAGNLVYVHAYTARPEARFLDWKSWDPVVVDHRAIVVGPTFGCIQWMHPIIAFQSMELQYLGAAHGATLSTVRSSRPLLDCTRRDVLRARTTLPDDAVVVLFAPETKPAESIHYERQGARCATFGPSGYLCSKRPLPTAPAFTPMRADVDYEPGTGMTLDAAASRYLGVGWSYPEGDLRWQTGDAGFVYLRPTRPLTPSMRLRIVLAGAIFPQRPTQSVEVFVNDAPAGGLLFTDAALHTLELPLPPSALGAPLVEIELRPSDARPPAELGFGTELRPNGVVVRELGITE